MTVMYPVWPPVNSDSSRTDVPYGCHRPTSSSLSVHGQDCDRVSTKSEHAGKEPRHRPPGLEGSQHGLGSGVIRPIASFWLALRDVGLLDEALQHLDPGLTPFAGNVGRTALDRIAHCGTGAEHGDSDCCPQRDRWHKHNQPALVKLRPCRIGPHWRRRHEICTTH
jgi:hypothetical protein